MVSAVVEAFLKRLQDGLYPMLQRNQIGLCAPSEASEQFALGIFVYAIQRNAHFQMAGIRESTVTHGPPLCLDAYFMVTSYAGRKSGLLDDYKILGRTAQLWADIAELKFAGPLQPAVISAPRIELLSPSMDEVSKIWQFPGAPYRLSLFYRCAPIAIPSGKEKLTARAESVNYAADDKHEEG